ncbi:MAG: ABC transporter permease [Candidatus Thermoplasmatota archaeon]|nr:ABC transporter permease [Candidatus Thermoplasmatota archaeon]
MRPRVVISDFNAHLRTWLRSKGGVFWTLFFPILLMLIFGAIFSGMGSQRFTLHVQNLDGGDFSVSYMENMSTVFDITEIPTDVDIHDYIRDRSLTVAVVIPSNFSAIIDSNIENITMARLGYIPEPIMQNTSIIIHSDPTGTTSGIVQQVVSSYNLHIAMGTQGAVPYITTTSESITPDDFKFIDFFLPGVIGLSIMTAAVYGTVFRNVKYKEDGILRKLTTTPMRRSEWIMAMMLFMTFTALLSTALIIFVGVVFFDVGIILNPIFLVIIVSEAFAFAGIGMIISRFVKEEETADSTAGAITFPMMFLAGTFFPLEQMPEYLQHIARFLPLFYATEGLRDSMIFDNPSGALFNTLVMFSLAAVFFVIGVFLTKWKE